MAVIFRMSFWNIFHWCNVSVFYQLLLKVIPDDPVDTFTLINGYTYLLAQVL